MTITDAFLIDPMAVEHARHVLAGELDMLHRGIGAKKRIEWLVAQRDTVCRDAVLFVPSTLAPFIDSLTTRDTVALLEIVRSNLASMKIGTTFRHLRNAERRMGLPGYVLDLITLQGAMLLLTDDEAFVASFQRALQPLVEHMESSPSFHDTELRYDEIMAQHDLETNKQRKALELAMQSMPDILVGMPDLDDSTVREIAFLYGRLLDQDVMLALSALVREVGAGIFDQLKDDIVDHATQTYRTVVSGLINDRITQLQGGNRSKGRGKGKNPSKDHTKGHKQDHGISQQDENPQTSLPEHDVLVSKSSTPASTSHAELLSIDETAAWLHVTRVTIHRLLKSGALSGTHIGRRHLVTRASIEKYLAL